MRRLEHNLTGIENEIQVTVTDEPGQGNACHEYEIIDENDNKLLSLISFQNGPIKEFGVNGITNETLLAIVIDRLQGFQSGDFRCKANACALTHLEEANMWLKQRTLDRVRRGVEGFNKQ